MHAIQLIDLVFICNNNQLVLVHPLCHLIYEKYYPKFLKHRAHIMYALLQNVKLCAADVASFQIIFPYKFNYLLGITFSSLCEKSLSNLNRCLNINSSKVEEKLLFVQWTTRNCTFAPVPREISIKINLLLSQTGRTTTQKASLKNVWLQNLISKQKCCICMLV